jgi:hypothetical protein
MNKILNIVNQILIVADLMDLMEYCDNNEYEKEAKVIAQYIYDNKPNVDSLARYTRQIFVEYFNEVFDMECMELIADCILKNLECEEE